MDYLVFATKAEASRELDQMRGWVKAHIAYVYWPDHPKATKAGNIIMIRTGDKFLRDDGYVR